MGKRKRQEAEPQVWAPRPAAPPCTEGVPKNQSGQGLPFAPEHFPNHGDVWGWRVAGDKVQANKWQYRYLYPPDTVRSALPGCPSYFHSKVGFTTFLQEYFPTLDIDDFFNSFHWKIPAAVPPEDNHSGNVKDNENETDNNEMVKATHSRLEERIQKTLNALKKSQQTEYELVEEKLGAQKDLIMSLLREAKRSSKIIIPDDGLEELHSEIEGFQKMLALKK